MNESFKFWFPVVWTLLGVLFSIFAFSLTLFLASTTDSQAPATPVLLEILAELRKMTKGDPKIQRGLRPFSLQVFLEAQAKVLARERIQATPNPFLDLD
ncbi:hypothetical protein GQ44DRAFT_625050 [Phaeosphaeriaceae sp. PMI808]|nr:hypothetical protein GQ44DRAFT_625050 [Phaeosphaeriaceae sp. PMI808]